MTMDIKGLNSGQLFNNGKSKPSNSITQGDGDSKPSNNSQAPGTPKDTVSLSAKAKSLSNLQSHTGNEGAIDQAKIDSVKIAINNGLYKPNADTIAQNMLKTDDLF